ncbi:hypothetical protein P3X46_014356 [Hevea brasiliensis]|uniref:Uncharacterized protein n=1 Tax=Hevea brasiliensis TaxID=3981 RepID=A0ABQ9M6E4_HEVBR|nr:hypothetical protein P3X46_014356 [Hevea brasiliensis]
MQEKIVLFLTIYHAMGIDNLMTNVFFANRIYKVESWIEEIGTLCMTLEVYGLPNPKLNRKFCIPLENQIWNKKFCIPLENPMDCRFLYLGVIRTHSKTDPRTSTGEALVGKIKIHLLELFTKIKYRFKLVRPEALGYKAEGSIQQAMEMKRL